MDELHTNAFVLRARSFAESDRIVVLLTEELGKISAIAKGARRSKRRFAGGALEPFQEIVARVSRKPHAQLAFLHECRVVAPNAAIAQRIEAFAWASYLTELTELMTPQGDPASDIYDLYRRVVLRLASEAPEQQSRSTRGAAGKQQRNCRVEGAPTAVHRRTPPAMRGLWRSTVA